jgi:hypothetical protein
VAFPVVVFHRTLKNIWLAALVAEHLGIAVLMGMPFFSLTMIAADAVFAPTALLVWIAGTLAAGGHRLRALLPWPGGPPSPTLAGQVPALPSQAPAPPQPAVAPAEPG